MVTVVMLLIVGALLMLAEVFLPGLIAGIIGFGCLVAGVIVAYTEFGVQTGNLVLLGVLAALVIGFFVWLKYFPESRIAKLFTSQRVSGELGTEQPQLLNQQGVAFTNLRPSGVAVINGRRVDVVSEGGMIPRGAVLKVVQVEGMRVVVRAVQQI